MQTTTTPLRLVLDTNVWLDWLAFDDATIMPLKRPLRNYTPTPSTPKGTYTQDDTGSQRNNFQWPSAHTSTQSSPPQTTWLPHAPSTLAKSGMYTQPHRTTPHVLYSKSYTPRTPKDTTTSAHGDQLTHTRTLNPSKETSANGRRTPLPSHHRQQSPRRT